MTGDQWPCVRSGTSGICLQLFSWQYSLPVPQFASISHQKVQNYPKTIEFLEGQMKLTEEHLNNNGRGYLVFEVPK